MNKRSRANMLYKIYNVFISSSKESILAHITSQSYMGGNNEHLKCSFVQGRTGSDAGGK